MIQFNLIGTWELDLFTGAVLVDGERLDDEIYYKVKQDFNGILNGHFYWESNGELIFEPEPFTLDLNTNLELCEQKAKEAIEYWDDYFDGDPIEDLNEDDEYGIS